MDLINQYDLARQRLISDPTDAKRERFEATLEDIEKFNRAIPTDPITTETLMKSQETREEERAKAVEGRVYNEKIPVDVGIMRARNP
jgi:hypothetical protein